MSNRKKEFSRYGPPIGKRPRCEQSQSSGIAEDNTPAKKKPISINLGKPSLRRRLEDYYSLIAPDVIADETEWRRKFDLIYRKYGGNVEGERSLAKKLAKKYGDIVRLRLAGVANGTTKGQLMVNVEPEDLSNRRSEAWYEISSIQRNSGEIDFTSIRFDPKAALSLPSESSALGSRLESSQKVYEVNPFIKKSPLLDNLAKFPCYLPSCDPLHKALNPRAVKRKHEASTTSSAPCTTSTSQMRKKIPVFTAMVAQYEGGNYSGPLTLLHSIHVRRQRVKVVVRYVDCIRGTITGYLLAFDKHLNMILRDADEVYTSRVTKLLETSEHGADANNSSLDHGFSKSELELMRRRRVEEFMSFQKVKGQGVQKNLDLVNNTCNRSGGESLERRIKVGMRHLHQILVRGDNIVSVYRADSNTVTKY